MGGDAGDMLKQVAGYGVGALSALTSLKGGGLQNYFINRQRLLEDPSFRASLVDSPFTSGVFFQPGSDVAAAAPGAMPSAAATAQPADFVGPPVPAQAVAAPNDVAWLAQQTPGRHFIPSLSPLSADTQVQVQAAQGIVSGLQSADPLVRAQAKLAGKIPLTPEETQKAIGGGIGLQKSLGPGGTVGLQIPGMPIQIGSPYNFASIGAEEYPTYEIAAAAAAARNTGLQPGSPEWHVMPSGRGTFVLAPPPTREQILPGAPPPPAMTGAMPGAPPVPVMRGATPPAKVPGPSATAAPPLFAGAVTTTGGPPPTVATRTNNPGNIKDGPFAQAQPGYVGTGPPATDGGHFAVFNSPDAGFAAMDANLQRPQYQGLTVGAGLNKWSGGGYGGDVAQQAGIDPSRQMSSLTPDERLTLSHTMSRREGYQGPPPTAVAPAPPPRATPPPPPPPRVAAAPAFDPNATVPHVIVPAPAPADATVGYPSAAPPPAPGVIVPTQIPTLTPPPVSEAPAGPPGAAVLPDTPVDLNTGLPLQSRTYESQTGSETFTAPPRGDDREQMLKRKYGITDWAQANPQQINDYMAEERALKNQDDFDKAAIARTQRGMTPEEQRISNRYILMKNAYDNFITQYSDPAERAKFLGWVNAPWETVLEKLGWRNAQAIKDFRNAMGPFAIESMTDEKGKAQPGFEGIAQTAPSPFDSAGAFESNLQHFGDLLNDQITLDSNTRGLPEGALMPKAVQGFLDQMRANRDAARAAASQPPPEAPAAPPPPPAAATAPPPSTPPATAPPWAPNWVR